MESNSSKTLEDLEQTLIEKVSLWSLPVAIFSGLAANLLAFIVLSSPKNKQINNPIVAVFFRAIILADSVTLLTGALPMFLRRLYPYDAHLDTRLLSLASCRLFYLLPYAVPATSAWLIVIVCIDRFFSIKMPNRFVRYRKNACFQWLVCLVTLAYNLLFYIQFDFSYLEYVSIGGNNATFTVKCKVPGDNNLLSWMDCITLKFIFICLTNVLVQTRYFTDPAIPRFRKKLFFF